MIQNASDPGPFSVKTPIMALAEDIVAHEPPYACPRHHVARKMPPCSQRATTTVDANPYADYLYKRLRVLMGRSRTRSAQVVTA